MAKWRYFAARELPRVIRELGIPCATPVVVTGMTRCPRHQQAIGAVTRMCSACTDEAWAEVGRRYSAGNPAGNKQKENTMQHQPQPTGMKAELVPLEGELVDPDEHDSTLPETLFGGDPELAVARIVKIADELSRIIRTQKLAVRIAGGEHVLVEGWTLLGTLLGVYPVLAWSRKLEDGWEARVEARTLDGRVVGAAESECLRTERKWAKVDDYAVRSMAATRATSKALRQPLGFVMSVAGFDVTPVEELPPEEGTRGSPAEKGPIPESIKPTADQDREIRRRLTELAELDPDTDWRARARELAGAPAKLLTATFAADLIERLEEEHARLNEEHDSAA
jgi:hypothetical protein